MRLWGAAFGAVLLVSCTSADPYRPVPPVVEVSMREYAFDYSVPNTAGRLVFHIRNSGHTGHRLVLVPLAEDFPEIRAQLRGTQRRFLTELAGVPDRPPGADGTFAADVLPGRYAFICFTIGSDGVGHSARGMASEFRVR